jgi:hypothetical protein
MEPLQSGGMSHATMYGGRYFVARKLLHPLAIKARGRIEQRGEKKGGESKETAEKKKQGGKKGKRKEQRGKETRRTQTHQKKRTGRIKKGNRGMRTG